MKNSLFLIFIFSCSFGYSQSKGPRVYQFKDQRLIRLLTSIDTIVYKNNDNIAVALFRIENPFGSAHLPETDEISIKYMVSVGYNDDTPGTQLFDLGDYINPKLLDFKELDKNSFLVALEYGIYNHRKKCSFLVKRTSVKLMRF